MRARIPLFFLFLIAYQQNNAQLNPYTNYRNYFQSSTTQNDSTNWKKSWDESGYNSFHPYVFTFYLKFKNNNRKITVHSFYNNHWKSQDLMSRLITQPLYHDTQFTEPDLKELFVSAATQNPLFTQLNWKDIDDGDKSIKEGKKRKTKEAEIYPIDLSELDSKKIVIIKKEENPWKFSGTENLQLSQIGYSNWVKGGENSFTLQNDLRLHYNYKKGSTEWENFMIHKIGVISTSEDIAKINDDLIEFNTKYGLKAYQKWFYSLQINFKTQFFNVYENGVYYSGFMAPGYSTFSLGMDYKSTNFNILISPLTSKTTIIRDIEKYDASQYNIPEGKNALSQTGFALSSNFKVIFGKTVLWTNRIELFKDYIVWSNQTQANIESILDLKINRFISTRFNINLIFIDNESNNWQIKENFSLAFKYKF